MMGHALPTLPRLQRGRLITGDLVGAWPLYERGGGTEILDVSDYSRHGTWYGAGAGVTEPGWTGGALGTGMSFDDTDDVIQCPQTVTDFPATMMAWMMKPALDTSEGAIEYGLGVVDSATTSFVADMLLLGTKVRTGQDRWHASRENADQPDSSRAAVTVGKWTHVCGTFEANDSTKCWVDGRFCYEATVNRGVSNIDATCIGGIRYDSGSSVHSTNLHMADVRIYNRVLEANEISLIASGFG